VLYSFGEELRLGWRARRRAEPTQSTA